MTRRAAPPRTALATGFILAALGGLAACDSDQQSLDVPTCEDVVREASLAPEVDEQVRLLDTAIRTCSDAAQITTEMERYPGIVGYDVATFLDLRCDRADDEAVLDSAVCVAYRPPPTTVAPVDATLVYEGVTLDGRRIEIRPSAEVTFVGDVPEIIQQTVDIAVESGCEGVIAQRDRWAAQVGDPVLGDLASVYANHAQTVAAFIGCPATPLPGA